MAEEKRGERKKQLDTASHSSRALRCCRPRNAGLKGHRTSGACYAPAGSRYMAILPTGALHRRSSSSPTPAIRLRTQRLCSEEEHVGETERVDTATSARFQDASCPSSSAMR